ncbi:MAG: hypothetical protein ACE5JG_02960 [Planctomycetota bacterium]
MSVADAGNAPLAGAVVSTLGARSVTDRDGKAWIVLSGGWHHSVRMSVRSRTISVRAPGYAPVHHRVGVLPWESPPPYRKVQLVRSVGGSADAASTRRGGRSPASGSTSTGSCIRPI